MDQMDPFDHLYPSSFGLCFIRFFNFPKLEKIAGKKEKIR